MVIEVNYDFIICRKIQDETQFLKSKKGKLNSPFYSCPFSKMGDNAHISYLFFVTHFHSHQFILQVIPNFKGEAYNDLNCILMFYSLLHCYIIAALLLMWKLYLPDLRARLLASVYLLGFQTQIQGQACT